METLTPEQFDLVINPTSVCYCQEPESVWSECFRILAKGGELISGLMNPNNFLFDAIERDRGKLVARHRIPYSDLDLESSEFERLKGSDHPIEFGHSFTTLIGGQLAAGFSADRIF